MSRHTYARPYMLTVIALGAAVGLFSAYSLDAARIDMPFLLLAVSTVTIASRMVVRLPRDEGSFKTIDAPSVLGELSFFDGYPRSATLEAVTDVEVVRIDLAAFDRLHEHEPAIANLMLRDLARILALRLRLASAVIADLRGS